LDSLIALSGDPAAWVALATLIVMEVVLGIDNLIFISILSNKLPEGQRQRARRVGLTFSGAMSSRSLSCTGWSLRSCARRPLSSGGTWMASSDGETADCGRIAYKLRALSTGSLREGERT
jgi:hypothetical protein